jgi:hypothetical protein
MSQSGPARSNLLNGGDGQLSALKLSRHTFEFHVGGSDTQEQRVPVKAEGGFIIGLDSVDADFARSQKGAGRESAPRPVSGLHVDAYMRKGELICRVEVADFAADDLLVIRVSVTLIQIVTSAMVGPELS